MRYLALGIGVGLLLSACTDSSDRFEKKMDDYFERRGPELVRKSLEELIRHKERVMRETTEPQILDGIQRGVEGAFVSGIPAQGVVEPDLEVVVFGTFQCPYTVRVQRDLMHLMKTKFRTEMRLSFRHLPLRRFELSDFLAKAGAAAHLQGRFWEWQQWALENHARLTRDLVLSSLSVADLDPDRFRDSLESGEVSEMVDQDRRFASTSGFISTPTVIINGAVFSGARDIDRLQGILEVLLAVKRGERDPDTLRPL